MIAYRAGITRSIVLASLCVGCNSTDPLDPAYKPNMDPGRWAAGSLAHNASSSDWPAPARLGRAINTAANEQNATLSKDE